MQAHSSRPEADTAKRLAPVAGGGEAAGLPCLYRNISIMEGGGTTLQTLTTAHKKSASALSWNVQELARVHGLERLGFLTLTFADHVTDRREAQRRFNSLSSNVLRSRYASFIRVWERQKSGRIHYHLLVALAVDIRAGFDFEAVARQDYKSASPALRSEWAFWRRTAKAYGFGRTELMPIRSTDEGIARYVGKYISKHMHARLDEDKGARLVDYSGMSRMASSRFAFATGGSRAWRRKVRLFAELVSASHGVPATFGGLRLALGPRWAWEFRESIFNLPEV